MQRDEGRRGEEGLANRDKVGLKSLPPRRESHLKLQRGGPAAGAHQLLAPTAD